ncbi:MAG: ArdC family protein [Planctomycetota bacterium]|nr:ArdC family protein [Planctomycetota bacterium]
MKAEEAKKIADHALETLADALKSGESEQLTRYLSMLAKFHRYSFGNVLLILSQMPDASHVAGFNTWKQMGRFVKKGEKGIVIIAPMSIRPKSDDQIEPREPSDGQAPSSPSKPTLRFRGVYVFDVTQTDGQPLPEPTRVEGDPRHYLAAIKEQVAKRGITLDSSDLPPGADGVSRGGRISIRPGLEPANEFSVIVHELAHELLHRGEQRPASKTVRETEAEAVAFVVCQAIGLQTGSAASDYIHLYNREAEHAVETLAASLDRIQRVAADIIATLQRESHEVAAA